MSERVLTCNKTNGCTNAGVECAAQKCSKVVCQECYVTKVLLKNKLTIHDALPRTANGDLRVACTKKCHEVLKKTLASGDPVRVAWDTDTPNGDFEGSSEAILLDWLKVHGNYSRWRGNREGISKQRIQQELADTINLDGISKGVPRNRTEKQVGAKIQQIERKYRETLSWKNHTGQGIKEDQGLDEVSFNCLVMKRWRHFFDLQPIFQDRSCMGPIFNSDDLSNNFSSSDDDSDESKEDENDPNDVRLLSPVQQVIVPSHEDDSSHSVDESNIDAKSSTAASVPSSVKRRKVETGSVITRRSYSKFQSGDVVRSLVEQFDRNKVRMTDLGERELMEKKRHNQVMENIERQKSQAAIFQAADAELDYQLKLQAQYENMKEKYSTERIAQSFPQLICFLDLNDMTEADKAKYAKRYNDWNEARNLPGRM